MGKYCLIKNKAEEFISRLQSGKIDPVKLAEMTSKQRRDFFTDFLGKDDAINVNSLFESKLLLKDKQRGMITWAKTVTGIKPEIRNDLLSRIQKMDERILNPENEKIFLEDLASTRLGISVTANEAKVIYDLSQKIKELKPEVIDLPNGHAKRLEFGATRRALEKFVNDRKTEAKREPFRAYLSNPAKGILELSGLTKALKATFDNSFIGRQGIKVLFTNPILWAKNAKESFRIIGRTLAGKEKMKSMGLDEVDAILADIYSRKNYERMRKAKLDIGTGEEAYPTSLPEKIPGVGRLFKASESAYTGTAYRMRADLFDHHIRIAERLGKDVDSPLFLESLGKMVNTMTGRSTLPFGLERASGPLNQAFFSVKFAQSNINTLAQPFLLLTDKIAPTPKFDPYVRRVAAINTIKIISGVATTLAAANMLWPGSVEWDSRSSDFGKIKIGNSRFDITGGMGSYVVLASRVLTQSKKSSTGVVKKLNEGFGQPTGEDLVFDFFANKLSPAASIVRNMVNQERFGGRPITLAGIVEDAALPLPISNAIETAQDPEGANIILAIIADGLGISTNTYGANVDWNINTGKELSQFRDFLGEDEFQYANDEYNSRVSEKISQLLRSDKYKNLSEDDKQTVISKMKDTIKQDIFKKYHFKAKNEKRDKESQKAIDELVEF